jgi:hypothetical protein
VKLTAVNFSRLLIAAMVLLAVGALASLYVLSLVLASTVTETDHAKIDAQLSRNDVDRLKKLGVDLRTDQEVIARAKNIVAESSSYQYQDQIVNDINAYAGRAGVKVLGYDFKATSTQSAAKNAPKSSVKTIAATLTLAGPMEFERLLKFLKAIEQNLTKMQVTSIDISKDDKNPKLVNDPNIGVEIYVK